MKNKKRVAGLLQYMRVLCVVVSALTPSLIVLGILSGGMPVKIYIFGLLACAILWVSYISAKRAADRAIDPSGKL